MPPLYKGLSGWASRESRVSSIRKTSPVSGWHKRSFCTQTKNCNIKIQVENPNNASSYQSGTPVRTKQQKQQFYLYSVFSKEIRRTRIIWVLRKQLWTSTNGKSVKSPQTIPQVDWSALLDGKNDLCWDLWFCISGYMIEFYMSWLIATGLCQSCNSSRTAPCSALKMKPVGAAAKPFENTLASSLILAISSTVLSVQTLP